MAPAHGAAFGGIGVEGSTTISQRLKSKAKARRETRDARRETETPANTEPDSRFDPKAKTKISEVERFPPKKDGGFRVQREAKRTQSKLQRQHRQRLPVRGGQLPWVWRKAQVTPGDGTSRGVPVYDCLKASAEGHA
jgi:hypothetical protein